VSRYPTRYPRIPCPIGEVLEETLKCWFEPLVGDWFPGTLVRSQWRDVFTDYPANRLCARYYPVFRRLRFDRIGIRLVGAGAAGALIRLGIYRDNGRMYPGQLVADAGEVAGDVAGDRVLDVDVVLEPGVYWLAYLSNDGTIDPVGVAYQIPPFGYGLHFPYGGYYVDGYTYGPLPATYPAGAAKESFPPAVALRVAEVL